MSQEEYKILVVDDDPFSAELTGITLESAGYDVIIAEGGIDALEKISQEPLIKIVVSDMNMPMINGAELFEELRAAGMNQPFILLTGDESGSLKQAYPDIDAVIAKDEDFQDVLPDLIEKLIAK